jgi:hypothetical protein
VLEIGHVPWVYSAYRLRWQDRDERIRIMDAVVRGDWDERDPNDETLENRSPNLIQVALEDTAESAALVPSLRVVPSKPTDAKKKMAHAMELLGASYMDQSQFELQSIQSFMDLAAFGFYAWTITYDKEMGGPLFRKRDPRTCFPEPGWKPGDSVRRCMFARQVFISQLPKEWLHKVQLAFPKADYRTVQGLQAKVILVEYYEEDEILLAALVAAAAPSAMNVMNTGAHGWSPVELDRMKTPGGICPVVIGQRITLDAEPRGQFDQVIPVMEAHIRLMAMVLDYADQAVYSDVWVKDLIGEMPFGGGAYISLGATGAIGRVPPAVSSLSVQQELETLVNNIHLGARWPKSRPGEIDQSIASAKFLESAAGMMNTVIRTYHLIMKQVLEVAIRVGFKIDEEVGQDRTIAGVQKNQNFLVEHKKSDIDLEARVRVVYGLGLGRDIAQSAVLGIQMMGAGLLSREDVQENFEGITDVAKAQERIDMQQLRDMALSMLLQGLQSGEIPKTALGEIANARGNGTTIIALYDKFVAKPAADAQASQLTSGLTGQGMPPGAPPAGGPQPPMPPDAAGLMAALGGKGGPPGAPPGPGGLAPTGPPQAMSSLSTPAGAGRGNYATTRI